MLIMSYSGGNTHQSRGPYDQPTATMTHHSMMLPHCNTAKWQILGVLLFLKKMAGDAVNLDMTSPEIHGWFVYKNKLDGHLSISSGSAISAKWQMTSLFVSEQLPGIHAGMI